MKSYWWYCDILTIGVCVKQWANPMGDLYVKNCLENESLHLTIGSILLDITHCHISMSM